MSTEIKHRVCPVERAGALDFTFRKLLQNPKKILQPYINEGMTALDLGCGPGFFTQEMARLVGKTGRVIAADLQEGMLAKVKAKVQGSEWATRITLHQCQADRIALSASCDFILVFYMLHEVPDQAAFFQELKTLLAPAGKVLIAEPKWHVSQNDFLQSIALAERSGLVVGAEPKIRFSRSLLLMNARPATS